jgi:tetraacyldisaccharide 4'-kinase
VHIAVCEKRAEGVRKIQETFPKNELIILDDAFQHRAVKAG